MLKFGKVGLGGEGTKKNISGQGKGNNQQLSK